MNDKTDEDYLSVMKRFDYPGISEGDLSKTGLSLTGKICDCILQITSTIHVARNVLTEAQGLIKLLCFDEADKVSEESLAVLELMVSVWNRSTAVFTPKAFSVSGIERIDRIFREKFKTPEGSISLFFSANNAILDAATSRRWGCRRLCRLPPRPPTA